MYQLFPALQLKYQYYIYIYIHIHSVASVGFMPAANGNTFDGLDISFY